MVELQAGVLGAEPVDLVALAAELALDARLARGRTDLLDGPAARLGVAEDAVRVRLGETDDLGHHVESEPLSVPKNMLGS
ncbi:MAG: hypothetical protein OXF33_00015 [Rhodospirillales bacterium]|nr:hypothetical protein [Rhodospirillales bacterium]MCY4002084.1 hypothetical protein [Rhodospirillales bacterium]MCY4097171.1 hypothetical protein [Rhodospirillales bacterium]